MAEADADAQLEALVEEFLACKRAGKAPTLDELVARHPEQSDAIRDLFPMIAAMEEAKVERQFGLSGRIRFGGARPERLGEFRILREIGRGGMGVVFEAHQESLDRRVALKVLPRTVQTAQARERFQREAKLAAALHHPNIVTVHSIGEAEGTPYFAMQLVQGCSWDRLIDHLAHTPEDRKSVLPAVVRSLLDGNMPAPAPAGAPSETYFKQVARMGSDAARGLHYAHERGMLHRDVKPGNLLLDVEGRVFLSDFGLARALQPAGNTATCDSVGTLRYMAPEQLENRADARSDVFGLGVALYELLTLQRAYDSAAAEGLLQKLRKGERPPLQLGSLPPELKAILMKATEARPERRFTSAAAFAKALDRYQTGRRAPFAITPARALLVGSLLGGLVVLGYWVLTRTVEPVQAPAPLFDRNRPGSPPVSPRFPQPDRRPEPLRPKTPPRNDF